MNHLLISRLHLENFQSFKDPVTIAFSPITLLYGQNSSGKSSVFDALKILDKLCNDNYVKDNLLDAVHMHDTDATMVIGAGFNARFLQRNWNDYSNYDLMNVLPTFDSFICNDEHFPSFDFDIYFHVRGGYIQTIEIKAENQELAVFTYQEFCIEINLDNPYLVEIDSRIKSDTGRTIRELCHYVIQNPKIHNNRVTIEPIYNPSGYGRISGNSRERMFTGYDHPLKPNLLASKERVYLEILLSFLLVAPLDHYSWKRRDHSAHIGPLRKIPKGNDLFFYMAYAHNKSITFKKSVTDWSMNWFDGSSAWKYLAVNDDYYNCNDDEMADYSLLPSVNDWLSAVNKLNMPYTIGRGLKTISYESVPLSDQQIIDHSTQDIYQELIAEVWLNAKSNNDKDLRLRLDDVGSGISQIVPILVAGFVKDQICIEQPELHLHPRLQTELADFFITRLNHNDVGSIIETHSEYLALRLLRRIRESKTSDIMPVALQLHESNIAFYYFDSKKGVTNVTALRVSDEGEFLDRWPKGFFRRGSGSCLMKIINKIAIDPESLPSWETFRYVMEKLGFAEGLVLAKFPKNWPKQLLNKLDVGDIERDKIVTKLQSYKHDRMVSSGLPYRTELSWTSNIVKMEQSDIDKILVLDKSTIEGHDDCVSTPLDADEDFFSTPREISILNTPQQLGAVAEVLIKNTSKVIFVDQYFKLHRTSAYLDSLSEFASTASRSGKCSDFLLYASSKYIPHDKEMEIERAFNKAILPGVKKGFRITTRYVDDSRNKKSLHARYLLADKGGLRYDKGFGPGNPPIYMDVSLLDKYMHIELYERFSATPNEYPIELEYTWSAGASKNS